MVVVVVVVVEVRSAEPSRAVVVAAREALKKERRRTGGGKKKKTGGAICYQLLVVSLQQIEAAQLSLSLPSSLIRRTRSSRGTTGFQVVVKALLLPPELCAAADSFLLAFSISECNSGAEQLSRVQSVVTDGPPQTYKRKTRKKIKQKTKHQQT